MERLQKAIAQSGYCSRRKAEEYILNGQVKVNGKVVDILGTQVSGNDKIEVNGQTLNREDHVYYLLNKPKGVISSTSDDKERKTVLEYIPEQRRLYPVGRLDWDTSGALILTNDGNFTNKMIHPKYHVPKTYLVNIQGILTKKDIEKIEKGFSSELGTFAPGKVKVKERNKSKKRTVLELTIYEGQNHQVKNMMEALGHSVRKLHRSRFGNLDVSELKPGEYRRIKPFEIKSLQRMAEKA